MAAAPGRVNLMGEHTDYNEGFVLPMAIDRYIVLAGGPASGDEFLVHSLNFKDSRAFRAGDPGGKRNGDWSNYLRGVVDGYRAEGFSPGPMEILVLSDVPLGAGLSSSAALEVATATLIEAAAGKSVGNKRKAFIAQYAEHEYAGMPCGIMDQFASAACQTDHLMLLDCRLAETRAIPFTDPEVELLIINSNVKHELTGSEYPQRRTQCERAAEILGVSALRDATLECLDQQRAAMDDVYYRRAKHIITENERTLEIADAVASSLWGKAGSLMNLSHASMRDDFEISCPELDLLVELAQVSGEPGGVFGSRMTGGGFGGCTVSLVQTAAVDEIAETIGNDYASRTGIEPSIYVSRPAGGARVLELDTSP
jgi:galactokinase